MRKSRALGKAEVVNNVSMPYLIQKCEASLHVYCAFFFLLNDKGSFLFIFSVSFSLSIFPSLSFFLPFSLSFAVSLSHSLGFCYLLLPPSLLFIYFWAVAKSGRIQGEISASIRLSVHPSICLSICTFISLFQCVSEAGRSLSDLCPGPP